MDTKSSNSKYRLLVLMDMSKASWIALKNAVQMAKVIDGSIEVFHVKAPTDVVTNENQFSAIRAIHEDYNNTKSRLRRMIRKIEKESEVSIRYQLAYGNIKNAIKEHIAKVQPEIVILGKRKHRLISFLDHNITKFVLKQCPNVLIVGEDHKFHSYSDISMGIYGEILQERGLEIINDLKQKNTSPIRLFRIRNRKDAQETATHHDNEEKMVSYTFSEGSNSLNGLASYISKTNIQLLCIPRKSTNDRLHQMILKLDIPVLFFG